MNLFTWRHQNFQTDHSYLSLEGRRLSRDLRTLLADLRNLIQHLILFLCQIQVNNLFIYLDLDLVLDLDLDLDLDLLPPSSISRILRPSNSSPSSFSKAYSMSLLEKSSISARDSYANLLPNSTMPSPTLGWLVLV